MIFNPKKYILHETGVPAQLEQLAEEAAELAHAALKYARILRGENPTPTDKDEAIQNLIEEYTDVRVCANILELKTSKELYSYKLQRCVDRLIEKSENNE